MFEMFIVLLFLFFALIILSNGHKRRKNFPNGPWRLPIIGNLHQFWQNPQITITKMSNSFGPMFSLKMGSYEFIILNDYKLVKEAMALQAFAGRPDYKHIAEHHERKGVLFSIGKDHVEQRRFTLKALKDLGIGNSSIEDLLREEINELMETIEMSNENSIKLEKLFSPASVNTLMSIIFGKRMEQNDPKYVYNLGLVHKFNPDQNSLKGIMIIMPWIRKLSKQLTGWNEILLSEENVANFVRSFIPSNLETRIENEPRNYIDAYYDEISKTKDKSSSFYGEKGKDLMIYTIWDLFAAGGETTKTFLSWACVALATYPEIQDKIREEMKKVVGLGTPSLLDRSKMPYMEAFINETLRISSIAYFGLPRCTMEDVEFHGYQIPAGTNIIANAYAAHYDKSAWGDPENFRPERFISPDGSLKKHEAFMPFGSGKRICLAEKFARDTSFIFLTSLVYYFQIFPDLENPEKPHLRFVNTAFTAGPEYSKVSFKKIRR